MKYGNFIMLETVMGEDEYLENRLDHQIKWYSTKSSDNQKYYKNLRTIEIVCAAIIPFMAGLGSIISCNEYIMGFLGVVIAVCAGVTALNKYQENWITYRTTCETLKHEKYLYLTKSIPYDDESAFHNLVERVESLISKENTQWSRVSKGKDEKKPKTST